MDGEGGKFDNDSTLEAPETARVRTASTLEDTNSRPCSPMSWADDVKHGLTQKSVENAPRLSVSHESDNDSKNKDRGKACHFPVSLTFVTVRIPA